MTKAEIVSAIALQTGIGKPHVEAALEAFFDVVKHTVSQGETINLRKFGNFKTKNRAKRLARNIKKNTTIEVEAYEYPTFRPSKLWIEEIRNGQNEQITTS
jgi:DNA-binding protein HU-beta